ncbi:hypothetical protein GCM10007920_24170 [Ciceribacter naphthalenivorans]|uniref:DDE domain-containing protein n=2 Tax=Alphaproteobacteria TaxID=28211 RepID=A0A512HNR3_9HYPH|nr:hypothetical protein RNA01_40240 [Ciceribacter naphthalenivorans]GLR22629.1 hypothetical protein GCM10007920_24170 [Ciceribacter naphthalenivorans]GLT05485.1 hypothetical protein GCM10007926_24170 [Sphingomonas psychrolutea]
MVANGMGSMGYNLHMLHRLPGAIHAQPMGSGLRADDQESSESVPPTHFGSVRIDATYVKIRGKWRYLYRVSMPREFSPEVGAGGVEGFSVAVRAAFVAARIPGAR